MRTVIICRGICCTRLAKATEGSKDASSLVRKIGKYSKEAQRELVQGKK